MGLGGYAADIARMAGYPPDHPRLTYALGYAEQVLASILGHLEDRTLTYSVTPTEEVRYVAIPPGEVLSASAQGRLVRPGLYRLDTPTTGTLTFSIRQNWTGANPLVLRAAADLVAAYLALPDLDAPRVFPPSLRAVLAQIVGGGVVG